MQYYTTQPEQDPSPVARVDSLNTFLQDVFPEVNDNPGALGGVINRAMPKEEIREMERNMKIREKAEKRAAKEERRRLGLEKGFLEKYVPQNPATIICGRQVNNPRIKTLTSPLFRSRSFFLSLSSSSSNPGLCPDRKIFWRRSTAPATVPVASQTLAVATPLLPDAPSVNSLDSPGNQNAQNTQNTQGVNGTIMPTVKVTSPTPVNGEGPQTEMVTEKTEGPAVRNDVPEGQGGKNEQSEEHPGFVGSLKRIFTLRLGARRATH
jgi:hypothetical protein